MEIEGWERLCKAKDMLLEEKKAEQEKMIDLVKKQLEKIGADTTNFEVCVYLSQPTTV